VVRGRRTTVRKTKPSDIRLMIRPSEELRNFLRQARDMAVRMGQLAWAVEALNRSLRKIIKTRGAFPNQEAAMKLLFLALRQAAKKWILNFSYT
jgi:transposase-like protein